MDARSVSGFVEYLKYEIGHLHGFNGVAPIYFVEVPGWDSKGFDQPCAAWVPVTTVELP